ncbi:MAG: VWA domain-containing protein [Jatrophihabitans sp.]
MFISPAFLLLLVVVALFAAAYIVLQVRRKKFVARFSNVELLGSIAPRRPGWRRHLTFAFLLIAMSVLSIGAAKPAKSVKVARENATVMLAIDVSLSMQATDVLPSRIVVARNAAKSFVGLLPSRINLGLVTFGGAATLNVPPTLNRGVVIKSIQDHTDLRQSTAIGEAIFTSLQAIQVFNSGTANKGDKPPPARIVLLSDGTNTYGRSVASAVAEAKKEHIEVSTIAFGRDDGTVTINGQTTPVPADKTTLRDIAGATGGSFHSAYSDEQLRSVYQDIGSQIGYTTKKRDVSYWFLVSGVLVLFAAGGASMLWSGRLV